MPFTPETPFFLVSGKGLPRTKHQQWMCWRSGTGPFPTPASLFSVITLRLQYFLCHDLAQSSENIQMLLGNDITPNKYKMLLKKTGLFSFSMLQSQFFLLCREKPACESFKAASVPFQKNTSVTQALLKGFFSGSTVIWYMEPKLFITNRIQQRMNLGDQGIPGSTKNIYIVRGGQIGFFFSLDL